MNFNNEKTIDHEFFINESHFVNYCFKVCRTQDIHDDRINVDTLTHFLWSLKHESVFKRNHVKPPYAVLIYVLKNGSTKDIDFIFGDYKNELIKLRYGNCALCDCHNIIKYEMFENGAYNVTYGEWGYSKKMLALLQQFQDKCGVYKLYDKDKNLIYIGKSYNLSNRVTASIKEQRAFYVKIMMTNTQSDANLLEIYYISEEKPPNNDAGFTFDKLTINISHQYKFTPIIKIYK